MTPRFRSFVLALAASAANGDWRIVPGERVGPVYAASSSDTLRAILGASSLVDKEIHIGEGVTEPGTVLWENDPSRALAILWKDPARRQGVERIFICYGLTSGPCRWRLDGGITYGTSLRALEKMNGRPFTLLGFGWDYSGTVSSWRGGSLERLNRNGRVLVRLTPRPGLVPGRELSGDREILSTNRDMQRLDPVIYHLVVEMGARQ